MAQELESGAQGTPEALADRNPVVDRLQDSLTEAQRVGDSVGLLLVHAAAVDRIDALHGFHAGDRMSNSVAQLLRTKALRKRDLIEPLSRDEFACILPRKASPCLRRTAS
jgi:GGDEF domain-containing protein